MRVPKQMPFWLVDRVEAIIPMESIVSSPRIVALAGVTDRGSLEERLTSLEELEEEWLGLDEGI